MMRSRPQRVQVFSLQGPRRGAQRRYYVKWRVDGRDRTRSFRTRAEADRFRSGLVVAVRDGEHFDETTGLPARWLPDPDTPTWWSWSREWAQRKWGQWSGHSRRSVVETLSLLTPLLVDPRATPPPVGLQRWLREIGYAPHDPPDSPSKAWLERWSIALADLDPTMIEDALSVVCVRADGEAVVPAVARRRRGVLGAVLRAAVRRGVLSANPLDAVEWRSPPATIAIDVATVPSPTDIQEVVDHVAALASPGARYAALFATIGLAGLRPSEAAGLVVADVDLPANGWGLASLRGAVTSPGTRYTGDGTVVETKGLKHRAPGAVREVPLPPPLVQQLRCHLEQFEPAAGRIFTNAAGRPVTPTNYGPVWVRARSQLWPAGHPLASATVYDLRHGAATMMLRAAVPPAEVARRLGHSVDVLMRVYAGVFDDERERSNQLIDQALRR